MNSKYAIVVTTCANDEDAKVIIDALLNEKLAACIQVFHVDSFYFWEGNVANDPESILFIKCKDSLYSEIENMIISNHKYEIPEIIKIPILDGYVNYTKWIEDVSK